ncbi:MAG: hypothetical protein JXM70_04410 [Pirellulales bacterium]|nr:hypothetical protein [Pirellulales bacterium]
MLDQNELQPVALNYYGGNETWSHVLNLPEEVSAYRDMMTAVLKQAARLASIEKELDDALVHLSRCGWELPDGVKRACG